MNLDHDGNFKKLLTTFFVEFVDLFCPQIRDCLIPESVEFLPQELFLDPTIVNSLEEQEGQKRILDLAAKVRVRQESAMDVPEQEMFFILHVDAQANQQAKFNRRIFRYFARLHDRYDLPVYPIALLTFDEPFKEQPNSYRVSFPSKTVLDFQYDVIQLNRLSWRDYLNNHNPVACALMAKMQIAPEDRPRVKFESLRLLATLRLDETRWKLVSSFVDEYLRLNVPEQEQFQGYLATLQPEEQEGVTMMTTSWKEEGRVEGRQEGYLALIEKLLSRRLGSLSSQELTQVRQLSLHKLEQLGEDLLDFRSSADLTAWLLSNG